MFFDDRLATVLRQRGDSETGARTQFRQLLDILGNRKFGPETQKDRSLIAAAWLRLKALAEQIPADQRAAIIRERGWRLRSADLTAHLADFEPEVASAALNRAELNADDWTDLIPRLPIRARGFLRLRSDLPVDAEELLERLGIYDRGLPQPPEDEHAATTGPIDDPVVEAVDASASVPRPAATDPVEPVAEGPTDGPLADFELTEDLELTSLAEPELKPGSDTEIEPAPVEPEPSIPPSGDNQELETEKSEISALVERIAKFRRDREMPGPSSDIAPRLPLDEAPLAPAKIPDAFGFTADPHGQIDWAEGEAGPMLVGTRLASQQGPSDDRAGSGIERAFLRRQPLVSLPIELDGGNAIAGSWIINAQPQFSQAGHFRGYAGRFLRALDDDAVTSASQDEADRIRQLLHELRTPVTAVQGYAEVIQQQLFGPAPHEYRALAASIAADAARILAGFEELDRLARLETGSADMVEGQCDFGAIIATMVDQLQQVLQPRMAGLVFDTPTPGTFNVPIDAEEAEGMAWRLLATLAASCSAGESLACEMTLRGGFLLLTCSLPAQLLSEDDVFSAEAKPISSSVNTGLFGSGFALRLARAEARAVGGNLKHLGETLELRLPLMPAGDTLTTETKARS